MEMAASLGLKMEQLAREFGPGTVELARSAALVEAWSQIYNNIMFAVICAGLAVVTYKLIPFFEAKRVVYRTWLEDGSSKWDRRPAMDDTDATALKVFCMVMTLMLGLAAVALVMTALNPWSIAQVANPDLVIARKILGL